MWGVPKRDLVSTLQVKLQAKRIVIAPALPRRHAGARDLYRRLARGAVGCAGRPPTKQTGGVLLQGDKVPPEW